MQALSSSSRRSDARDPISRLDARTKMTLCLVCSVTVIFLKGFLPLSILLAASFLYLLLLRRFRVMFIAYCAVALMSLLALLCVKLMARMIPEMSGFDLAQFLNPFLRVTILLNVVLALALSSRVQDILTALRSLRLPLFLYLPAVVTVRFIPGFLHDIRQISESLRIRGYSLHPLFISLHPLLSLRLVFVPVVVRALRSSEELAIAAELKGLGHAERMTSYRTGRLASADYWALGIAAVLVAVSCLLSLQTALTS
jgi:energy-coupling factor transport system permease protein